MLDTAPVWEGATPAQSLRDTIDLAQRVERLGYRRYWMAEHHNTRSIASSSPAVLVGQLASATSTLRIGSGGVMLTNHAPLVVAEQFGTLEALHPGRIDLGVGRAPGTDPKTARALRRTPGETAVKAGEAGEPGQDFPKEVAELMGYLAGPGEDDPAPIHAIPAAGNGPPLWLLGSGTSSARLAGQLGLPFAFAHHFSPDNLMPALDIYRHSFTASAAGDRPYVLVCTLVIAADTDEHADWLSSSLGLASHRMSAGLPHGPHIPPAEAAQHPYTPAERELVRQRLSSRIIGGPETVRRRVFELLARTQADELMAITLIHRQVDRIRSYEVLAEAIALGDPDPRTDAPNVPSAQHDH